MVSPYLAADHKDHHQAVERNDKGGRHLHSALQLVGSHQQGTKQKRGWDGANGMQLAEQGGHDAVKACAAGKASRRAISNHTIIEAINLDYARQPGKCTA